MKQYASNHLGDLVDPGKLLTFASMTIGIAAGYLLKFFLQEVIIATMIVWGIDLAWGSIKALRRGLWIPSRLFWSGLKLASYLCLILFGDLLRWGIGGTAGNAVFCTFTSIVILTEASSILLHAAEACPEELGPIKEILLSLAKISRNTRRKVEKSNAPETT